MAQLISPRLIKVGDSDEPGYVLKVVDGKLQWAEETFSGVLDSAEVLRLSKEYLKNLKVDIVKSTSAPAEFNIGLRGVGQPRYNNIYLSEESLFLGEGEIKQSGDDIVFVTADGTEIPLKDFDSDIVLKIVDSDYILERSPGFGPQGTQGIQGFVGDSGFRGNSTIGVQGPQGVRGLRGPQGVQGFTGAQGIRGNAFGLGPQGTQGIQGNNGSVGLQGVLGNRGAQGTSGTSVQGVQGLTGVQGTRGLQGSDDPDQSPRGIQGIQGIQEIQGIQGRIGTDGVQGPVGFRGLQGPEGFTRDNSQGVQGIIGLDGLQAAQGTQGIAATPPSKQIDILCDVRNTQSYLAIGEYETNGTDFTNAGCGVYISSNGFRFALAGTSSVSLTPITCSNYIIPRCSVIMANYDCCLPYDAYGCNSVIIGDQAGAGTQDPSDNVNPSTYNVMIGDFAGGCSCVERSVLIGRNAGTRLGERAGQAALGSGTDKKRFIAIGYNAFLQAPYAGGNNIAVGARAFGSGCTRWIDQNNIAIGYGAACNYASSDVLPPQNVDGQPGLNYVGNNIMIGAEAGVGFLGSKDNVVIGHRAGSGFKFACCNIAIGNLAAGLVTHCGCNNIALGAETFFSSQFVCNEIILGSPQVQSLRSDVTTITSLSDCRDKTNIKDLCFGLNFIEKMRPVRFEWDHRDSNEAYKNVVDIGFIAQELKALESDQQSEYLTHMILEREDDRLEATPLRSYPIVIQALKQLSQELDEFEAEVDAWIGGQL